MTINTGFVFERMNMLGANIVLHAQDWPILHLRRVQRQIRNVDEGRGLHSP